MDFARALPRRIKAKTQKQALQRYFGFLTRSLSCVANAAWYVGPQTKSGKQVALIASSPLCLERKNGTHLFLEGTQTFHFIPHPDYPGDLKVKTDSYAFTLSLHENFESELLSFQWHPESKITTPHVHAALEGEPGFHKAHIPTRRILLEDVLWLAIEDFGVVPIRDDWQPILKDAISRVQEFGSWT